MFAPALVDGYSGVAPRRSRRIDVGGFEVRDGRAYGGSIVRTTLAFESVFGRDYDCGFVENKSSIFRRRNGCRKCQQGRIVPARAALLGSADERFSLSLPRLRRPFTCQKRESNSADLSMQAGSR